jgi:hypothetical protein
MNVPVTPPTAPPYHHTPLFPRGFDKVLDCQLFAGGTRNNKLRRALRPFVMAAVAAAVLLMQPSYVHAQHSSPPSSGPSEKEKVKAQEKRIYEKDTDEAYRSTLSRIPDSKQKIDPWSNVRTAPAK